MKKIVETLLIGVILVIAAVPVVASIETLVISANGDFVPGELIVKFKNGVDSTTIAAVHARWGLSVVSTHARAGFQLMKIPSGASVVQLVEVLRNNPWVEYAEPNFIAYAMMSPNDPYYSYQWHLQSIGGINMEPAWDVSTGVGTIVAIVDTGIRVGSDLAGTSFVPGYDFYNNDNDPIDDNGHGTHVAGTVAQTTNNNQGVAGVAFGATLMPVKVLNNLGSGTYTTIANGIYYAVDNGAKIISMSLGGSIGSSTLQNAVAYAYNHGVTCVAASGNNGVNGVLYPAAYDAYVIAVGATQYDKTRAPYSNYGASLDLMAPGGNTDIDQNGDGYGDGVLQQTFELSGSTVTWGYYFYQGTSMATPHVSGTAALLYSQGITSPDAIRSTLQATATDLGSAGWDLYYGYGLVNPLVALQYNPGNTPPTCTLTANPTSGVAPLTTTFTMTATDPDGTIASWTLDTNNDGTPEYSGSGNPPSTQSYTYTTPGTYIAKLTVTDNDNAIGFDTETITVISSNIPPSCTLSANPTSGVAPLTTTFTMTATDPDGTIASWTLDTNNDGTPEYSGTGSPPSTQTYTYITPGTYTAKLTVVDDDNAQGSATVIITVTSANAAPNTPQKPSGPTTGLKNKLYRYTTSTTDPNGDKVYYLWDWGDGTTSGWFGPYTSGKKVTQSHKWLVPGVYLVTVKAKDVYGAESSWSQPLTVTIQ